MQEVKMIGHGRYSISRVGDGVGDSGPMLESINPETLETTSGVIKVGCRIRCGSIYARTYASQDWWLTSKVTEIFDHEEGEFSSSCKFRTESNSVYICKNF